MQRHLLFFLFFLSAATAFAQTPTVADSADAAYQKQDYASARDFYLQAREQFYAAKNDKEWKRTTEQIVRCSTALGETERAVLEYLLLCRKTLEPPLDCVPLPWFVPVKNTLGVRPHEKGAEDFLEVKIPCLAGELLAAATLSVSADNAKRLRGIQRLRELSQIQNTPKAAETVPLLAAALLWKQRIPTLKKAEELRVLKHLAETLPENQRFGVYFLLGNATQQVGDLETAVLYWMRIPILFPEQKPLAKESLHNAAAALEKLGRKEQSVRLRSGDTRIYSAPQIFRLCLGND
jgi:tetratricopeptide (TPR) repeat protein